MYIHICRYTDIDIDVGIEMDTHSCLVQIYSLTPPAAEGLAMPCAMKSFGSLKERRENTRTLQEHLRCVALTY